MFQRNATGYPLLLPTFEPPIEVPPGWEIEHTVLLAGFEPAGHDPEQQPELVGRDSAEPDPAPLEV